VASRRVGYTTFDVVSQPRGRRHHFPVPKPPATAVFAARMKAQRIALGISQAELGVRMGIPADVASTRINRYERGVHAPDLDTLRSMAQELGVPLPYLLAEDERLAKAILGFASLPKGAQEKILAEIEAAGRTRSKADKKV